MSKRLIALILSIVIVISCVLPAFASEKKTIKDGNPVILVRGMDFMGLTYNMGKEDEANCFGGVEAGELIAALMKALAIRVFTGSTDRFVSSFVEYLDRIMGKMACNPDGTSKYDISVTEYPLSLANYPELWNCSDECEMGFLKGAVERYGAENVYYLNYDWRLDPFVNAAKINDLVNTALKDSGKEKVDIVCCSMGGMVTVSYMYKYGWDKLDKVIFQSSTICGTHVTTDLLQGKVDITTQNVYIYAKQMLASNNKALGNLFDILYKTGVIGGLVNFVNGLIPKLKEPVYDMFLRDTFGTMPAMWALVLPDDYEAAKEYIFSGREEKYSELIALTDEYNKMQSQRDEMLKKAEADGVYIALSAGYNGAVIPVYTGGGGSGDHILESDLMLGHGKVADLGKDFGSSYTGERVSPDKMVDLSDCLFPDTTWAARDMMHVPLNYGSDALELVFTILEYDGRFTVDTDPRFPQFMKGDGGCGLSLW